jgi:hypothetical protein
MRRRTVLVSAAALGTVAVSGCATTRRPESATAAGPLDSPGHEAVVAAYSAADDGTYWLLDPESGDYRRVPAAVLTVSPDLRSAVLRTDVIIDARTGATQGRLDLGDDWDADWSPDGHRLALTRRKGSYATDIWLGELRFVDPTRRTTTTVSLPDREPYVPERVLGWLDGGYLLATRTGRYARVDTGGRIQVQHSDVPLVRRPVLEPQLALLEGNDVAYYDLRSHTVSTRVSNAQLPSADKPLPGLPKGVAPLASLDRYHSLVAAGRALLLWDIRDGSRRDAGQLPRPPLGAVVCAAAGRRGISVLTLRE